MDLPLRSPLVDLFRRGDVPRDVRLLAAQGGIAPRALDQLTILLLLAGDADAEVAATAERTLASLPRPALEAFLARQDVPDELRAACVARGIVASKAPSLASLPAAEVGPLGDLGGEAGLEALELELEGLLTAEQTSAPDPAGEEQPARRPLTLLPVVDRIKVAMRGTREQRAVLVRDANKLVSTAVLSSPKLTESEVESFARMANVSEEVLRIIGTNRSWTKNYGVIAALARNPKTPPAVSMPMVARLNERDLKMLSTDRNVPEGLRLAARKLVVSNQSRRR